MPFQADFVQLMRVTLGLSCEICTCPGVRGFVGSRRGTIPRGWSCQVFCDQLQIVLLFHQNATCVTQSHQCPGKVGAVRGVGAGEVPKLCPGCNPGTEGAPGATPRSCCVPGQDLGLTSPQQTLPSWICGVSRDLHCFCPRGKAIPAHGMEQSLFLCGAEEFQPFLLETKPLAGEELGDPLPECLLIPACPDNHGMVWVGRDPKAHLIPPPAMAAAPSLLQPGLGHFQGSRTSHSCSGHLCQRLPTMARLALDGLEGHIQPKPFHDCSLGFQAEICQADPCCCGSVLTQVSSSQEFVGNLGMRSSLSITEPLRGSKGPQMSLLCVCRSCTEPLGSGLNTME